MFSKGRMFKKSQYETLTKELFSLKFYNIDDCIVLMNAEINFLNFSSIVNTSDFGNKA